MTTEAHRTAPATPEAATLALTGVTLPSGGLVVVLPAKDESRSLPAVLASLPSQVHGLAVTPLVVDDGSSDGTAEVARAAGAEALTLPPGGQGVALRTGYALAREAGAAAVVSMDSDGQHRAEDLPVLLAPLLAGQADVVQGSRVLGSAAPNQRVRELGVVTLAQVMSAATGRRVTDPSCGFRALSRTALERLSLSAVQFHTAELLVNAARRGLRVVEVPVRIDARTHGESRKPTTWRYALGFTRTLATTWVRGARG